MATKYIDFRQEVIGVGKPLIPNSSLDTTTGFAPRTEATYGPFGSIQDAIDSLNVIFPDGLDTIPIAAPVCIVTDAEYDNDGYLISGILNEYRLESLISDSLTTSSWDTYFKPYAKSSGVTEQYVDDKVSSAIEPIHNNVVITASKKQPDNTSLTRRYGSYDSSNVFVADTSLDVSANDAVKTLDIEKILGYSPIPYVDFDNNQENNYVGSQNGVSSEASTGIAGNSFAQVNLTKDDIWVGTWSQYVRAGVSGVDFNKYTLVIITNDGSGVVDIHTSTSVNYIPTIPNIQ